VSDIDKIWVRLCALDQVPTNRAIDVNVNGQRLILARCGDTASVMQGFCSHMLFPLASSSIEGCVMTCALHQSRFDVRDGSVVDWSAYPPLVGKALAGIREHKALRTFETKIADGEVYVLWSATDPANVRVKV
jgi:nitrite reductase/ring-hydroxylating ferredoxin subunit